MIRLNALIATISCTFTIPGVSGVWTGRGSKNTTKRFFYHGHEVSVFPVHCTYRVVLYYSEMENKESDMFDIPTFILAQLFFVLRLTQLGFHDSLYLRWAPD